MIDECPMCGKRHDSEEYDEGWYFLCCFLLLVWTRTPGGELRLEIAPGQSDEVDPDYEIPEIDLGGEG